MRQISPESPGIFDFIMDLHHACGGQWNMFVEQCHITTEELDAFLEYAGMFLCNLGNFYVSFKGLLLLTSTELSRVKATKSSSPI